MNNKRKQLIIFPAIQYKLILLIALSLVIPVIIISFWSFTILNNLISISEAENEITRSALIYSAKSIFWAITVGFSSLTILLLYWACIFSNHVVGPIYRLENALDKIIANKYDGSVSFRKHDHFSSLASKVNQLLSEIRSRKNAGKY